MPLEIEQPLSVSRVQGPAAPSGFEARLKRYDPNLTAKWNP